MSVMPITVVGDPVLRTPAAPLSRGELEEPDTQRFIDDLIETKRAANGAGLAANQVGDRRRIAIVEVEPDNPRYPYKPPCPLTVLVNPLVVRRSREQIEINEGCLSVPDLRGSVPRSAEIEVEYQDREGEPCRQTVRGLTQALSSTRSTTSMACCFWTASATPGPSRAGRCSTATSDASSRCTRGWWWSAGDREPALVRACLAGR